MTPLIQRLQAADGPSRELDCLIRERLDSRYTLKDRIIYYGEPTGEHVGEDGQFYPSPHYTSIFEDARSLVPPGHGYYVRENCSADGDEIYCNAQVWPYANPRDEDARTYWANAPQGQPALALCIAALLAREHRNG